MTGVGSKAATSGKGYFMGDFIGLEATIKSKREFPDEPGNWAYFSFTDEDHKSIKKLRTRNHRQIATVVTRRPRKMTLFLRNIILFSVPESRSRRMPSEANK